ncbi:hypothetical protein OEA41_009153 [Lepraria neglecta]|uniref:PKS/mFAS DH domain-containing protein n=1 Tax=Lepraria neglecta TaxID=209136 RepID=A0AAD9Z131_9LECA|nr:hypothetical protein OEA41_009153 [Lepraria neglecta]
MGRELMYRCPIYAAAIERADAALTALGASWSLLGKTTSLLYIALQKAHLMCIEGLSKGNDDSLVNQAVVSQPACTAVQIGLIDLFLSWDIIPRGAAGHSSGEIAAAYATGALSFEDCTSLAYFRGIATLKFKEKLPKLKGAMTAIGRAPSDLSNLLTSFPNPDFVLACINCPSSITISGNEAAIAVLEEEAKRRSLFHRRLHTDLAYHCHHMQLVAEDYRSSIGHLSPAATSTVNIVRLDEAPWLKQHKVRGNVVYPVAGYVVLAIEGALSRARSKGHSVGTTELREICSHSVLTVPQAVDVEIMTVLRPHNESSRSTSSSRDEFRMFSWQPEHGWNEHCRGLISTQSNLRGSRTAISSAGEGAETGRNASFEPETTSPPQAEGRAPEQLVPGGHQATVSPPAESGELGIGSSYGSENTESPLAGGSDAGSGASSGLETCISSTSEVSLDAGTEFGGRLSLHGRLDRSDSSSREVIASISAYRDGLKPVVQVEGLCMRQVSDAKSLIHATKTAFKLKWKPDLHFLTPPLYQELCKLGPPQLKPRERILIHTGAGGVGQAAIMLAQKTSAEVFTTVGSPENQDLRVKAYGLSEDHIFSSRYLELGQQIRKATGNKGVDVVLNSLSVEYLRVGWGCLASFGGLIEIGKRDIEMNARLEMVQFSRSTTFASVDLAMVMEERPQLMQRLLNDIMSLLRGGEIKPATPITAYPISELQSAFRSLQSGKAMGKFIIEPSEQDMVMVS